MPPRRCWLAVACALAAACGRGATPPAAVGSAPTVTDEPLHDDALVAAVAARWDALPEARRAAHPMRGRIDALIARPDAATVMARPCADARRAILDVDPDPDPVLLVDGSLDDLDGGDCRVVSYPGLLGPGLEAVLRPDGRVLLIRIVPEG